MKQLSRRAFSGALIGTGAALALPKRAAAQTLVPVKGAITSVYYDATPILWAQKTGMFSKAGIDLDLGRLPTGAAVTAAVAGGSLNIGKSTFFAVVAAFAHGVPIVVIAPGVVYDSKFPNGALVVPKDSPIQKAADLSRQSHLRQQPERTDASGNRTLAAEEQRRQRRGEVRRGADVRDVGGARRQTGRHRVSHRAGDG